MKIKNGSRKWILNRIICDLVLILIIKNKKKTHENCSFYIRAMDFFYALYVPSPQHIRNHFFFFIPCFYYHHFIHLKQAGQVLSRAFVIWIKSARNVRLKSFLTCTPDGINLHFVPPTHSLSLRRLHRRRVVCIYTWIYRNNGLCH